MQKISGRKWSVIILFGFIGQIAWIVENFYFNTFLFNEIGGTTTDVSRMVGTSALVGTLATLLMGTLSDRSGARRLFISIGYFVWGIIIACFSFISRENVAQFTAANQVVATAVVLVIIMDWIMTFIGSTANDANFNAWVTESVDTTNRGKVEGFLSIFPLLAMVLINGISGLLIDSIGYPLFFISLGVIVSMAGVVGLFLIPKNREVEETKHLDNYFTTIIYGFRPRIIKGNAKLYLSFLCQVIFSTAFQVVMPYLIIYMQHYLKMSTITYSLVLVSCIFASSVIGIIFGRLVDHYGRRRFAYITLVVFATGLLLYYFIRSTSLVILAGIIMMSGYVTVLIIINTSIRDYTPQENVGLFQGVRMIFTVLIPMTVGPTIGDAIIQNSAETFMNQYNEVTKIPIPGIFLAAAIIAMLVLIPMSFLINKSKSM